MPAPSGLNVGVALPQGSADGNVDVELIRTYATRAEALGFDDLWTIEQITSRFAVLEPVAVLNYVAAVTTRIRLGTAVLVLNLRNPVQLANELTSIDHLSGGRITVGVGLGTTTRNYAAFGMPEERRVARFNEGIRLLKALWTQPQATLDGDFWKLNGVSMEPKPVQKPHPPLWFGAHSEAAMLRTARHADGWMGAGSTDLKEFFIELKRMREIAKEQGRDLATFAFSKRIYIAVNSDEAKARADISQWLNSFYGRPEAIADSWAVYGSPARCLEILGRMRDAGLTHIMLHPAPTTLEHLERLASEILPKL
jgi:probable F420-dependent oxidoreductase